MSWFESLVLGLVQGLTEFLPISSSAHLRLTAAFSGWQDPGAAFTAITQIGTEAAVLIYFRQDIGRIVSAWFRSLRDREARRDHDAKMGWLVIVGSIPIGVLGVALKDHIEGPFRDLRVTATMLILVGVVIGVADRLAERAAEAAERPVEGGVRPVGSGVRPVGGGGRPVGSGGRHRLRRPKDLTHLGVRDGLIFGLCQAMALVPGVSRSGATISGGLFMGYRREAAARYSFLLAIPAVLASGLFELKDAAEGSHVSWGPTFLATVIAFVCGYAVIAWFMKFISTKSFMPFVWYRIALGLLILGLITTGVLSPHAADV
ncbi:undecaprenyl-diphosphate phosphatase [Streptomyces sp. NPDC002734]|uniref:undecaprenyl-diphosphate phosphatase n=1 Tax=Streptomyces sp. NPDC002734 TaxID=3154426 RepID=UPI00333066A0